MYNDYTRTGI